MMKLVGVNPDPKAREMLDIAISVPIQVALRNESVSVDEVVFLLTRKLAQLAEGEIVAGHLAAAYECAAKRKEKPMLGAEVFVRKQMPHVD